MVILPRGGYMLEARIVNVMGGEKVLKRQIHSEVDFADAINIGIPLQAVKNIQTYIGANDTHMARLINVSPKTFRTRKVFKSDEGDHAYMIARIVVAAEEAIGEKETAIAWLNSKQPALGDRIPMELILNSAGVQAVEDLLGRIEYGVYS